MIPIVSKYFFAGAVLAIIFIFGFWLRRTGKPYNTILLTIHKLIGLGLGVTILINANGIHRVTPLNTAGLSATGITALLFAALIVTGGLISAEITVPIALKRVHSILPYPAVLSIGATIYFLF